jgi:hypothetical protein
VKPFSVNVTMRTGGAGRPFRQDCISANVPGFQIGVSHGRRIASSDGINQPRLSLAALPA